MTNSIYRAMDTIFSAWDGPDFEAYLTEGDFHITDIQGRIPLHHAYDLPMVLRRRLVAISEVNFTDNLGATPLHIAAASGNFEFCVELLEAGASESLQIKDGEGDFPIHMAARAGSTEIVKMFLSKGVDINCQGDQGYSLLHWAYKSGNPDLVKFLLAEGADPELRSDFGFLYNERV